MLYLGQEYCAAFKVSNARADVYLPVDTVGTRQNFERLFCDQCRRDLVTSGLY